MRLNKLLFITIYSSQLLQKASYVGHIDVDVPRFGDIVVLAKGKLKQSQNGNFYFEQVNKSCDRQCQQNANQYLKNVTALWMVERIRHRDSERGHRYDLKFTIVPIYDNRQLKDNMFENRLENRLKNQPKKCFILRDFDYPHYFHSLPASNNRRTDLFTSHFDSSLSKFMGYNPSNIFQEIFSGLNLIAPPVPLFQNISSSKKSILNLGEYFMQPSIISKYQNNNNYFVPSVNTHAGALNNNGRLKLPDSREGSTITFPSATHHYNHLIKSNQPRNPIIFQNPVLKQEQSINNDILIDHRGAVEHIFGKNNINYRQNIVNPTTFPLTGNQHNQQQQNHPNINFLPLQSIRSSSAVQTQPFQQQIGGKQFLINQMPVQYGQTSYAYTPQIQLATPNNQILLKQPDQTTFRYQVPILDSKNIYSQPLSTPSFHYLPKDHQPIHNFVRFDTDNTFNHQNSTSQNFKQSERTENINYSLPDPVYFPSTTENYARATTYYSDPQVVTRKVKMYNDHGYQPMDSLFPLTTDSPISRINLLQNHVENNTEETQLETIVLKQPNSINSQLPDLGTGENITIPFASLPDDHQKAIHLLPTDSIKKNITEKTENYDIILKRPTFHQKTTEKPILKWIPKKNRDKSTTSYPSSQSQFSPTPIPTAKTTTLRVPLKYVVRNMTRGRSRFNSRRTSTTTSTPIQLTSKENKKKFRTTRSPTTKTNTPIPFEFSTVFPTYVFTESTQEPFTLQSFSTSISLVVGGSQSVITTEIPKRYEMVQAGVEPLVTNLKNIKLYSASNVENTFLKSPDFDNLTFSILNHARAIETYENDENN